MAYGVLTQQIANGLFETPALAVADDGLLRRRTVMNTREQGAHVWTSKRFKGNA